MASYSYICFQSERITKGESLVRAYRDATQDSGNTLQRVFCGTCATPLYLYGGEGAGRRLAVFYSALDDFGVEGDQGPPPPQVEYYTKDRVSWVKPIEGAEQPRTWPGRD